MKKPRTSGQLIDQLDEDFAWRLMELASIKRMISTQTGVNQSAILRAAIPVLYAHWEGYIKSTSIRYAHFIGIGGFHFKDLKGNFRGLAALSHVKTMHSITKRIFVAGELLAALESIDEESVTLPLDDYISNVGNLNYAMFEQIANFLGIETSPYEARRNLIEESLLKRRNEIAHGNYLLIDLDSFTALMDEILALLRQFKNDVQNAAVLKSYLRLTS